MAAGLRGRGGVGAHSGGRAGRAPAGPAKTAAGRGFAPGHAAAPRS